MLDIGGVLDEKMRKGIARQISGLPEPVRPGDQEIGPERAGVARHLLGWSDWGQWLIGRTSRASSALLVVSRLMSVSV